MEAIFSFACAVIGEIKAQNSEQAVKFNFRILTVTIAFPRLRHYARGEAQSSRLVLSGRRPKPDVGNLFDEQAHAPLPLPAGHARMPPGLQYGDRVHRIEVSTPRSPAFTRSHLELA